MILNHIPQRPGSVIIPRPVLDPELLTCRDLHVIDIAVIPEMLEDRVGKPQYHDVLGGLFAEEMVDAKCALFVKGIAHCCIEMPCRLQVGSERLFYDHARPAPVGGGGQTGAL